MFGKNGHEVKVFVLDNESSNDLKLAIMKIDTEHELILPHTHQLNAV